MKKILFATIAASMAFSVHAYKNIQEAYAAKDFTYIATNKPLARITKVQEIIVNTQDRIAMADAYFAAGNWYYSAQLSNKAHDNARWIASMKLGQTKNFVDSINGYYVMTWPSRIFEILEPDNHDFFTSYVSYLADCVADTEKAAKCHCLPAFSSCLTVWNKRFPDQAVNYIPSDDAIRAYASSKCFSSTTIFSFVGCNELNMKLFQAKVWTNDVHRATFARLADKRVTKTNQTTFRQLALHGTTDPYVKAVLASEVNDAGALLDALASIKQDMFTAKELATIINILNGQPTSWRAEELKTALKNINSMYTLKLYDDRDTWEPIISKVRAMLDAR